MPSRRLLLLLVPVALVVAGVGYRLVYPQYDGPSLDAPTALQMVQEQQITLVDIRRPDEWQATGIAAGAHRLDLRRPDFIDALDTLLEGDRARPVALICARGVRSARLANLLSESGFSSVFNIPEGMLGAAGGPGWIARGLPLARD